MSIVFIGGGNMAQAILGGLARKGFDTHGITVVEPVASLRERLADEYRVRVAASPEEAPRLQELAVMAVKPQQMKEAATALAPRLGPELVLSIAAGTRLSSLKRWLGGHELLARCMPNTPALIGEGVTGLYFAPQVTVERRRLAVQVLEAVGGVVEVESEALLDPVTAISGSGPAYVFYFLEAMQQAASELGLSPEQGRALSLATFQGASKLAAASHDSPAVLRERVTSKGGTTERALASMEADRVKDAIVRALRAASARGVELGDLSEKD